MYPKTNDYEAISRNSTVEGVTDLISLGVAINNGNITTGQILDYVAKRTDVAFRRGYWRRGQELCIPQETVK